MERLVRARDAVIDVVYSSLGSGGGHAGVDSRRSESYAAELIDHVLEALLASLGGDAAGLWEHVRGGWSTPLFVAPVEVWRRLPYGRTLTSDAAKIHPGVRHCLEAHPSAPFTVTDLISDRAWQTSAIGRAMRGQWGRNLQLMIPVDTASPTFWVWVVGRQTVDFGTDDRLVASALQPVLTGVTRHFAAERRATQPIDVGSSLTPRESSVLTLMLDGQSSEAIAARLNISRRTVHKHVERIYRKMGVHDRGSLIASVLDSP